MSFDDNPAFLTWRARPDMSCEYVNPAWLDYTGYTLEQALGEGWSRCLHPEDLARWLEACVRAFDAREPFAIEYRLRRRDGEYRWMLDRAAPRFSADGVFLAYTGGCVDIDEHKRTEHDLSRALERERRLRGAQSRAMSSLLARGAFPTGPLLIGVRVLVVDADRGAREDVVRPLEVAGADVRAAASLSEALPTLGAWQPDVVLTESDGGLRAAALTEDRDRRPATRCDARLAKPVEPVALLATVARLAA